MERQTAVPFQKVELGRGFWHDRQKQNSDTTIYNVYNRFKETGRFDALRCDWHEGMKDKPDIFWDSDIAKWIEAAAYILEKKPDPRLEEIIDGVVEQIEKSQLPDGYYNSHFIPCEPDGRFTRRTDHELYCAGHLFEAAVAYAQATGKEKFLHLMCKFADLIEDIFKTRRSAPYFTPGHEEIELALVKLYRYTGEKRYLELSHWFVEERGRHPEMTYDFVNNRYHQDQAPVREMDTAEGHAVRALYLYCAMADLAFEYQDEEMLAACRRLFDNISKQRMYITGGIGSSRYGEAFTLDYDLPNLTAYAETCAAISLIFFSQRMLLCSPESKFADVAEKALYNGSLSGISLDGKAFFYENPLEIVPKLKGRNISQRNVCEPLAITQRVEVFDCSCCPPNITRLLASLGSLLYSVSCDTLYVHHYMDSTAEVELSGKKCGVTQTTEYPRDGKVALHLKGMAGKKIALRLPGWCPDAKITSDGKEVDFCNENGYAVIDVSCDDKDFLLELSMPVVFMQANSRVRDDAGKVAVQRGPIVYCAEAVDNGEDLWALELDMSAPVIVEPNDRWLNTIVAHGKRELPGDGLYRSAGAVEYKRQEIRFIPYYAFANRGESEMSVWMRKY